MSSDVEPWNDPDGMKTRSTAAELSELIERYTPEIARDFKTDRRKMRAMVPRGYELVYDNYNALGVGYGYGQKSSSVIVSIVAYPRWINLFFMQGAKLKDPQSLLQGKGRQVRSIRLRSPADLDRSEVKALVAEALEPYSDVLAGCPRVQTVIKSVAAKRRARRPREEG